MKVLQIRVEICTIYHGQNRCTSRFMCFECKEWGGFLGFGKNYSQFQLKHGHIPAIPRRWNGPKWKCQFLGLWPNWLAFFAIYRKSVLYAILNMYQWKFFSAYMSGSSSPSTASSAPTIYQLSSLPPPSTLSETSIDTDLLKPPGMGKPRSKINTRVRTVLQTFFFDNI